MKILIISDAWHPQVNGVVRTYEYICEELERAGHQTHVIGPADFPRRIPMPGYDEIKLALAPYRRLKKLVEDFAPDYIHIATEGPLGWAGRKYCMQHGIEFTTSYHTHFPDYTAKRLSRFLPFLYKPVHGISKAIVRHFHKEAQAMFIATQSLEDELKSWGFRTPMIRLTRGVNFDLFHPGKKTLFDDLQKPVALYVGRVAIEKNIEDFLRMEWEGSKVIVGDGPSREELAAQYPDAHFVGVKTGEELGAHYRSADLFVFPSRTDTFGMVLVEALASGIPVAAYNVTGPKDIITEPILGALEETDLAAAAQKALQAPGSAEERTEYVRTHYSWEAVGKQFENGISKALNQI
ncbi:MAG: glycosyltransferase family 1 protein [Alphaproteobacteria bacterium]|nr:glycosyltransferase family 1 protein [Alphaproteobacteria bacterium]